jgi:hypothetical protein
MALIREIDNSESTKYFNYFKGGVKVINTVTWWSQHGMAGVSGFTNNVIDGPSQIIGLERCGR